jgi:hypothetical protein
MLENVTINYIVDIEIACVESLFRNDLSVAPIICKITIDLWKSVAPLYFLSLLICIYWIV